MKNLLILFGALGFVFLLDGQTNPPAALTNAAPATPLAPSAIRILPADASLTNASAGEWVELRITSERLKETLDDHVFTFVFRENVRVVDPRLKMTCEVLTVKMPETRHQINSIVAETNVVIDAIDNEGKPVHAEAQKAVYSYRIADNVTNEIVELTGNPRVHSPGKADLTGGVITWNLTDNGFEARGGTEVALPMPRSGTNGPSRLFPVRKSP